MPGLFDQLLPGLFSAGNTAKRKLRGLLDDPAGTLAATVADVREGARRDWEATGAPAQGLGVLGSVPEVRDAAKARQDQQALDLAMNFVSPLTFAGVGAKTADKMAQARAVLMEKAGVDPRQIWSDTGWYRAPWDKKWRFEISDHNVRPLPRTEAERAALDAGDPTTVPRQAVVAHPALSAAYPQTKDIPVTLRRGDSSTASFSAAGPEIRQYADPSLGYKVDPSTTIHELQHAVQQVEGFSPGGSPNQMAKFILQRDRNNRRAQPLIDEYHNPDPAVQASVRQGLLDITHSNMTLPRNLFKAEDEWDAYVKLAGEAEARATQARLALTPEQRRGLFPLDSFDVPINELIPMPVRGR